MGKIDHPEYYKAGGIEAIDVIEDWKLDFCLGNAIKYIARAGKKSDDARTDFKKAAWYIQRHKRGVELGILEEIPPKEPTRYYPVHLKEAWGLNFMAGQVISKIYAAPRGAKRSGIAYSDSMSGAIECLEEVISMNIWPNWREINRKALREVQKMSSYEDYRDFILDKLDERALLEQLAEEASELSQAALKLIRAKALSNNVSPKTEQEALLALAEEMVDCSIVIDLLCGQNWEIVGTIRENILAGSDDIKTSPKWKRWAERLGYED